jgi:hypothetical protein
MLLVAFPALVTAQTGNPPVAVPAATQNAPEGLSGPAAAGQKTNQESDTKQASGSARRRAAKLFLAASKLFMSEQFEAAMHDYEQAAALDPANNDYRLAADVARGHVVTALIQAAAKDRLRGDAVGERTALARALELDPKNIEVTEHLHQLADDALAGEVKPAYERSASSIGEDVVLTPTAGPHTFHLHMDERQLIQQVFKAWGIETTLDDSIRPGLVRLDIDNAGFETATQALELVTKSFYVPLDAHRALVAHDTKANRDEYTRQDLETIYLSGLSAAELTDVSTLAKNVFGVQQASTDAAVSTITIRAPATLLNAFNATIQELLDGHSQVLLDVDMLQLAHTSSRNTGVTPPQTFTAFNLYSEEQSLFAANASTIQQAVSAGLISPGNTGEILGLLLAAGLVPNSLFSNGVALFGGGITSSALAPGATTLNFNLNSSDSRELDQLQLRLGDGEDGTLKIGSRYPIQTSSFSGLGASVPSIPGLTGAGNSSSLSSLLAQYSSAVPNVPQVEYQDLGFTLKVTPKVVRNDDVALTVDFKVTSLAGSSINGNPILNNRAYSGVVTLRRDEVVTVVCEIDKSESRAITGTPGIGEIPGLNNISDNNAQKNYATLLIVLTPHVLRGTQASGHTPMMRVERGVVQ